RNGQPPAPTCCCAQCWRRRGLRSEDAAAATPLIRSSPLWTEKYSPSARRSGSIRGCGWGAINMKIDEYVAQTLIDISKGVARAKKDTLIGIAPGYVDGEKVFKEQLVSFEIATTVANEGGG